MNSYAIWTAALAIAAGFVAISFWLPVKLMPSVRFPNSRMDAVNERRKTFSQIFGGAAVILTFTWTILKDGESLEQGRQQAANREFLDASKVFSGSIENTPVVRTAGIYALGRVAATRREYHMPMRDTLVAFLERTRVERKCRPRDQLAPIAPDLQAAIQVLGDRERDWDTPTRWLDLHDLTLPSANMSSTKGFRGVYLRGAVLFGANLRFADLRKAYFGGICASDYQAYGETWQDSMRAEPEWSYRQFAFVINFEGADLTGAKFTDAEIAGASFEDANVDRVDFSGANLSSVNFKGTRNLATAIFHAKGSRPACADSPVKLPAGLQLTIGRC